LRETPPVKREGEKRGEAASISVCIQEKRIENCFRRKEGRKEKNSPSAPPPLPGKRGKRPDYVGRRGKGREKGRFRFDHYP